MTRSMLTKLAGGLAAALFTAAAVLEIARIVAGERFPGMLLPASYVVAALFAALWLAAAAACLLRHRRLALVAVIGSLGFLPHSILEWLGNVPSGIASLVAFAVVIVLVHYAFLGSLHLARVDSDSHAV